MTNAVIYARYSSYNQTERSIEGQLEDCKAYAERNNIHIIGEYIDRAISGTSAERRPDFQRMIADSKKGLFSIILVWKIDRFARNRYDAAIYKHILKKNNVKLISINEPIAEDPTGIMLESLLEGMAEFYSANLSQNVKRGMRVARERGLFTGGKILYGYRLDENRRLVIDEKEAEAVRYVFEEYAKGKRLKDIIEYLNKKGYKPRDGAKFTINSFQHSLSNNKYLGEYNDDGTINPGAHPRIISDDVWNAVQKRRKLVQHAPAAAKAKVDYQLQGKIFCGMCGSPMVGESGKGKLNVVYHYYSCANRKKLHTCKKKNEKKDFIEWYVVEQTLLYVLTPDRIKYIAEQLAAQYEKEFSAEAIKNLERQIEKTEKEIDECAESFIAVKIPALREKIEQKAELLSAQLEDMKEDLATIKIAQRHALSIDDYKKWLMSFAGGDPLDEEYRKRVIDTFVNAIYLYDDKVVIYYNIQGGQQVSFIEMCEDLEGLISCDTYSFPSGSNITCNALPVSMKSEHLFILDKWLFGIVIKR